MTDAQTAPADTLVFHSMPADSATAIVAFSGRSIEPGRFQFFNLTKHFPETALLFVRDPSENWYNTGLPEVGETVEEIAEQIREEIAKLGAKRVVTIGTSMGGYAAILFGSMIGAEHAVVFAPQTLLDLRVPILSPAADIELQAPDVIPTLNEAPDLRLDLVVGWENLLDVFHAQRVASAPLARVLSVPAVGHAVVKELKDEGKLWPLIAELIEGNTPSICEAKQKFAAETVERLGDAIRAWGDRNWSAVAEAMSPVVEHHPDWAAANFALAKGMALSGDWRGAEAALSTAMETGPSLLRPQIELAKSLIKENRIAEAENALRGVFLVVN